MSERRAVGWTVVAATGDRFAGFAPFVPSVNRDGVVAFQAGLPGGGSGVFRRVDGVVTEVVAPPLLAEVTSHPDVDAAGNVSFYGTLADGVAGAFLAHEGGLDMLAGTDGPLTSIGPLGPTSSDAGAVAFRGGTAAGAGVFVAVAGTVTQVACEADGWSAFHGLPVAAETGEVVFRADRSDGVAGVYRAQAGSVTPVVETGGTYTTLGRFPSAGENGSVAFVATLSVGGAGVFLAHPDGRIEAVERDAQESYRGSLVAGDVIVRIATPHGGSLGLFAGPDPVADRLLAVGDPLLGSTVTDLAANPVSVSASGLLAVRATLADGRDVVLLTRVGSR